MRMRIDSATVRVKTDSVLPATPDFTDPAAARFADWLGAPRVRWASVLPGCST